MPVSPDANLEKFVSSYGPDRPELYTIVLSTDYVGSKAYDLKMVSFNSDNNHAQFISSDRAGVLYVDVARVPSPDKRVVQRMQYQLRSLQAGSDIILTHLVHEKKGFNTRYSIPYIINCYEKYSTAKSYRIEHLTGRNISVAFSEYRKTPAQPEITPDEYKHAMRVRFHLGTVDEARDFVVDRQDASKNGGWVTSNSPSVNLDFDLDGGLVAVRDNRDMSVVKPEDPNASEVTVPNSKYAFKIKRDPANRRMEVERVDTTREERSWILSIPDQSYAGEHVPEFVRLIRWRRSASFRVIPEKYVAGLRIG